MATPSGFPQFRADARAEGQRNAAEQRRHGRHHDRPEAQQRRLVDRVGGVLALFALGFQREVDHHDAVLLHDADQQNDADDGDDIQVQMKQLKRQQRSHARRRQRRKNGDGMDEALVQHAENDVDRHQSRQNQQPFVGERTLEGSGRTLVVGDHAGRNLRFGDHLVDRIQRLAERISRTQIEGDGHGRKLPLVIDRERLALGLELGEGAQRNRRLRRTTPPEVPLPPDPCRWMMPDAWFRSRTCSRSMRCCCRCSCSTAQSCSKL